MSELGTHKQYVGYSALKNYFETQNKVSYCSFLELNRDVIISSLPANAKWKELDHTWMINFNREAKRILQHKDYKDLKEKSGVGADIGLESGVGNDIGSESGVGADIGFESGVGNDISSKSGVGTEPHPDIGSGRK
ncbi:9339_t:CDS:2, partial [Gigaspora rosea]